MKTTTHIDDLELDLTVLGIVFDVLVQAKKAEVVIEYEFRPGQREIRHAAPEDCQEGFPAQVNIRKVIAAAPIHFHNEGIELTISAGTNIKNMVPGDRIEKEEERLFAMMNEEALA